MSAPGSKGGPWHGVKAVATTTRRLRGREINQGEPARNGTERLANDRVRWRPHAGWGEGESLRPSAAEEETPAKQGGETQHAGRLGNRSAGGAKGPAPTVCQAAFASTTARRNPRS